MKAHWIKVVPENFSAIAETMTLEEFGAFVRLYMHAVRAGGLVKSPALGRRSVIGDIRVWRRVADTLVDRGLFEYHAEGLRLVGFSHTLFGRQTAPRWVREALEARDGALCGMCGTAEDLSVDHIVPVSLGGSDQISNLRLLCRPCNSSKASQRVEAHQ